MRMSRFSPLGVNFYQAEDVSSQNTIAEYGGKRLVGSFQYRTRTGRTEEKEAKQPCTFIKYFRGKKENKDFVFGCTEKLQKSNKKVDCCGCLQVSYRWLC